ncbi:hypothetical protein [Halobacillus ihumii]|uniref:hypothetical protein n=1 Tax=Halobacillus ihumii TaxID=2686092 RepID=UPI0013D17CB3|nr:hypothetical protein [Halobacillus ihumii]
MKNETNIKVPKKYQGMIEIVENDGDGYWAIAKEGYYFGNMGYGVHTAHEYTQKEILAAIRTIQECDCEQCEHNEEEAAEENEEVITTASVRKAGKKFEYNVVLPDGRVAKRKSEKSNYQFVLAAYDNGSWGVLSYHSRKDLAEKNRNSYAGIFEKFQMIEVESNEEIETPEEVTFEKHGTFWKASNGMSIKAKHFPKVGYIVKDADKNEIDFVPTIHEAKAIIKKA